MLRMREPNFAEMTRQGRIALVLKTENLLEAPQRSFLERDVVRICGGDTYKSPQAVANGRRGSGWRNRFVQRASLEISQRCMQLIHLDGDV